MPELIKSEPERRYLAIEKAEMRVKTTDNKRILEGYAAVFDVWTNIGWFKEIIRKGSFSETIRNDDIRALWNHNPDFPFARNTSGTLKLSEDDHGLHYEFEIPNTTYGNDLIENVNNKTVTQNSFGFSILDEKWGKENGDEYREILKVMLYDISPVTYSAYPQTSLNMRSIFNQSGLNFENLAAIFNRFQRGLPLSPEDRAIISASIEKLKSYLPIPEQTPSEKEDINQQKKAADAVFLLRKKLEITDKKLV
jgi:HK97 family phage prohead protease